jgi:hypothetical protein
MLPKRADPVAGAFVATIVFAALVVPPVLILALIVWLVLRARRSKVPANPEVDAEFNSRFHDLEDDILDAKATKATRSPRRRRLGRDR